MRSMTKRSSTDSSPGFGGDDETPSPSQNMKLVEGAWRLEPYGFPTLVPETSIENTIIARHTADGDGRLLDRVPPFITRDAGARARYQPRWAIAGWSPALFAVRRFLEGS